MGDSNNNSNDYHQMGRRGHQKNYCWPGIYHITINVEDRCQQPLGRIAGDASKADGDPEAPHVVLSVVGKMVEQELLGSITGHYSMIEVQDYVIMPDHLHCIMVVHSTIISKNGRVTHLGQVIAGFKKGCNRRYWEITGQTNEGGLLSWRSKPANASNATAAQTTAAQTAAAQTAAAQTTAAQYSRPAVYPQGYKVPSTGSSHRPPLFASGYVDVMPLQPGQLEQQRQYIRNNPRYRLLRMTNRSTLQPIRGGINTALTLPALKRYLQQECSTKQFNDETWAHIQRRLLIKEKGAATAACTIDQTAYTGASTIDQTAYTGASPNEQTAYIDCDSYGDRGLLKERLLPVVCHRDDIRMGLFSKQKEQCLAAAINGTVLVSARIAKGEQEIMDAAFDKGFPVITIEDNGLPELYHPSERRMNLCNEKRLLIVTPWQYEYRPASEQITVAECKTMNCIAQALCRTKNDWWKKL